MPQAACFLVVAHSARLLAQSAARARHLVCALDLFNDADTRVLALSSEKVDSRAGEGPGFDRQDLLRRAARLCPPSRCLGLIYGAGFEDDTPTLALLARGRELLGNPPDVVARLKDPAEFFGLLDRLAIAHPQTALEPPEQPRGWLYKRRGATGGSHVVDASLAGGDPVGGNGYFQRRAAGRNLSLLFLADGRDAEVIAISRQLTRCVGGRRYTYAGAVGPIDVPGAAFRRLNDALQALVADTGLVGCNSLDFLLEDDRPAVLEVNPRPSATMDLYDRDWRDGLFDAHVRACRGSLPKVFRPMRGKPVRAHAIVYAGARLRIAPETEFAAWCSDIPRSGSDVQIDAPVCTVHAGGVDPQVALRQLGRRRRQAERNLARQHDSEETGNEFKDQATECESHRGSPGCIAAGTSR